MAEAKAKAKKASKRARVDLLDALGLASEAELVRYLPHEFLDYTNPSTDFMDALDRGRCCLRVRWVSRQVNFQARPMNMQAVLEDASGRTATIWFFGGGLFAHRDTTPGTEVFISGAVETWGGGLTLRNAEILPPGQAGAIVPIYRGKGGLSSQEIGARVRKAFELHGASALLAALQAAGKAIGVSDRDQVPGAPHESLRPKERRCRQGRAKGSTQACGARGRSPSQDDGARSGAGVRYRYPVGAHHRVGRRAPISTHTRPEACVAGHNRGSA